jgi:hypothetical protein
MGPDWHNDLLPLLFAALGIFGAFRCGRLPRSVAAAVALQPLPALGMWVATAFC